MTNYNGRLSELLTELRSGTINFDNEAKQAITSLIKELVAEAKPERNVVITVVDKVRNNTIGEFEQNLLKALEEV